MCGIIAGISENIYQIIYNGLKNLQNRGYDSAGISIIYNSNIITNKKACNDTCNALKLIMTNKYNESIIGIGHTRWATHGTKMDNNSHPHLSNDKKISLVHNGIIENFKEIKRMLIKNNFVFYSETDTEVIVNLISYYYYKYKCLKKSIKKATSLMKGSWAVVLLFIDEPNKLYVFKNGNPLLISYNKHKCLITSEESGFDNKVNEYFILDDNNICIISITNNIISIESNQDYLMRKINNNNNNLKGKYKHWMLKEIYDQPITINKLLNNIIINNNINLPELDNNIDKLNSIDNLILLGCGTSLNACNYSLYFFKKICKFSIVLSKDGSELSKYDIPKTGKTAFILCSQSGETRDLYKCIEFANKYNILTIGVINVVNSLIARNVNYNCYINCEKEVAVASTKSFTNQCILLSLLSLWFSQIHYKNKKKIIREKIIKDLLILSNQFNYLLNNKNILDNIKKICKNIQNNSCFIISKGNGIYIADEGSLKIKEVSYIHCESYSSSSLKHGPFALLEKNFPVILLCPDDNFKIKNNNAYNEIKSRNAKIIKISNKNGDINIPYNKTYNYLLINVILQLIAYNLSINKNINPDFPRNLAKVVTVE